MSDITIQVTFDCTDPHRLARFWADALGYEVEDHQPLIEELLESGLASDADTTTVDGRLAWREAAACHDPAGTAPRLLFQAVPEPKAVKNRVHLDLHLPPGRRETEVERLVALGATRLGEGQQGPLRWDVLGDPEGNELCVGST